MIGSTVSRYKVLERLGGGGSGVVYKARDTKLERFVALKFLSSFRHANEADKRRFLREARAASVLDHPNLCTIYEIDETEEGRLFIAMAFCEGETLKARIERGPLPVAMAVGLAAQIAAGLEAAHEKGIVHRDVKPANVIVMPGERVKIVDFGIAQLADETRLTRAGTAVGTAAYMSPEQLRGDPIDARTDVWSLGVLLYEALTGRMPFPGENDQERIRGILNAPAEPLGALRPGVPPELERIVARALAKSPADRYPGMKEMREDLAGVQGFSLASSMSLAGLEPTIIAIPAPPTGTRVQDDTGQSLTGRVLGHYRILELIGGGGMGIVYKAEDLRLARVVALKFLPPELTRDPEAKARFLQEARAASALDHPNICTVHEVGETDEGRLYLSMPCYDGETLRRRIERGPLSIDEATDVAQQIAKGLAKAHRGGIVHRDIKPANLVITSDGVVKILDFGLAKLAGAVAITRTGSSVGTPAYMSPEQARGEDVDHRTDLWSLGVVLYEMVTGKRPFRGEHEQAVLYSILNEKPKTLTEIRTDVPVELEKIVDGLLAKNPADRYPTVDGALAGLKALRNEPMTATVRTDSVVVPKAPGPRPWVWAAVAAAAAVAGIGGFLLSRSGGGGRAGADPLHANYSRLTNQEGSETFPSLSPDGGELVYVKASSPGNRDLWHQRVGGSNPRNLTADSAFDDSQPAFSPDGQQIAFRSEREGGGLFVMGATGESVRRLTDTGYNPAWSPDGTKIAFATEGVEDPLERRTDSQLWTLSLTSGEKRLLVKGDAVQPSWSPHGQRIAYWGLPPDSSERILWTVSAQGGEPVKATDGAHLDWNPVWSPEGRHLYFVSDRSGSMNVWRVPIDEDSGKVLGDPEPVTSSSQSLGLLSLSKDGKLVYATNESRSNLVRLSFDAERGTILGEPQPVTQGAQAVRSAVASPDGQWIAFDTASPQEDLFAIHPDGTGLRQLTNDVARDRIPRWSPDGSRILFYSDRGGEYGAWTIRLDASDLKAIPHGPGPLYNPLWSPDGRWLAGSLGNGNAALVDLTLPVERRLKLLPPPGRGQVFSPTSWSADGGRLAGTVDAAEQTERSEGLGIALYSLASGTYEKVTESGRTPRWLSHGRGLVYLDDDRIHLLDLETRQSRPLLAPSASSVFGSVNVSPDDRTLLTVRTSDEGDIWLRTVQAVPER
ncbi:MAG TPA: protein kinase [Thermoanaerobaculia bacterium]|nr:protein kinase [Thermoanaerobaculia bacterium]